MAVDDSLYETSSFGKCHFSLFLVCLKQTSVSVLKEENTLVYTVIVSIHKVHLLNYIHT